MLKMFKKADDQGFTLIELLIVIAIIGILAAIAVPIFLSQADNADAAAAQSEASALNSLVGANFSIDGTPGTLTDSGTAPNVIWNYAGEAGTMTIQDAGSATGVQILGTPVAGSPAATSTNYCVTVTVGTSTAAYGPGANAGNTGCL